MAIELTHDRTMNPMVNAGAIATTSLVPGATAADKWAFVVEGLSRFAGRANAPSPALSVFPVAPDASQGLVTLISGHASTMGREAAEVRALLERRVDGLMLVGRSRSPELYELLESQGVPFVTTCHFDDAMRVTPAPAR